MAEDALAELDGDHLDGDLDGDSLAVDKKAEKKPRRRTAGQIVLQATLGISGLLLIIGFFFPWLDLQGLGVFSGMELVLPDTPESALIEDETQRYLLLVIPGFGAALAGIGFSGVRWSGQISAVLGILLVFYGLVTFIIFFFQRTGIGLWLVLGGTFLAILAGTIAWVRARSTKNIDPGEPLKLSD